MMKKSSNETLKLITTSALILRTLSKVTTLTMPTLIKYQEHAFTSQVSFIGSTDYYITGETQYFQIFNININDKTIHNSCTLQRSLTLASTSGNGFGRIIFTDDLIGLVTSGHKLNRLVLDKNNIPSGPVSLSVYDPIPVVLTYKFESVDKTQDNTFFFTTQTNDLTFKKAYKLNTGDTQIALTFNLEFLGKSIAVKNGSPYIVIGSIIQNPRRIYDFTKSGPEINDYEASHGRSIIGDENALVVDEERDFYLILSEQTLERIDFNSGGKLRTIVLEEWTKESDVPESEVPGGTGGPFVNANSKIIKSMSLVRLPRTNYAFACNFYRDLAVFDFMNEEEEIYYWQTPPQNSKANIFLDELSLHPPPEV